MGKRSPDQCVAGCVDAPMAGQSRGSCTRVGLPFRSVFICVGCEERSQYEELRSCLRRRRRKGTATGVRL